MKIVQASDPIPDHADEDIYFRPYLDGEVSGKEYQYHYAGDVGFHYWVDPHYMDPRDEDHYDWPVDINGQASTNTEVFNTLSVGARVENVVSKQRLSSPVNEVDLVLSISGAYQLRDGSIDGSHIYDSDHFWGTREVQLSAEMIDGPDDASINHNIVPERGFRSDNLLDSEVEVEDPYGKQKDLATYTAKFAGEQAFDWVVGEIPGGTTARLLGEYGYGAYETWTKEDGGVQTEDPDHKSFGSGLNDPSITTFYHESEPMGNSITGMQEDPDGNEPIEYQASIALDWNFDNSIFEDTDSAKIGITAKNIVGVIGPNYDYETKGATSYVEIEIKNAEPTEVEELVTDADHYDAGEHSSVVSPVFKNLKVTNPAQCTDVTYEVEIKWRPDWKNSFETLTYAWFTHGEELNKQVNIHVPEGTEDASVDIRYTVSTSDTYGGWEMDSVTHNNLFTVTNEEDDNGGGGGGGGGDSPPNLPWGDDKWFEEK